MHVTSLLETNKSVGSKTMNLAKYNIKHFVSIILHSSGQQDVNRIMVDFSTWKLY